jgi:hypothetical protein
LNNYIGDVYRFIPNKHYEFLIGYENNKLIFIEVYDFYMWKWNHEQINRFYIRII